MTCVRLPCTQVSYQGAKTILGAAPVTYEIDLWYRNLVTDGLLRAFVACPNVVREDGSAPAP
jgi:hypothetical protein